MAIYDFFKNNKMLQNKAHSKILNKNPFFEGLKFHGFFQNIIHSRTESGPIGDKVNALKEKYPVYAASMHTSRYDILKKKIFL